MLITGYLIARKISVAHVFYAEGASACGVNEVMVSPTLLIQTRKKESNIMKALGFDEFKQDPQQPVLSGCDNISLNMYTIRKKKQE